MSGVEPMGCPPGLHSVHECNTRREEQGAGEGQQPDVEAVEALDGPGADTETPEAAEERSAGAEPVEPEPESPVFTRADAYQVLNLLVSGRGREPRDTWSPEERQAEERLFDFQRERIDAECTHPEPEPPTALCNYDHTKEEHERVGACERPGLGQRRRPHWLPEQVWLGIKVGEWPLTAFTSQESAERWASVAGIGERERRIWAVDIPVDTQTFKVEQIPASTKLVEVQW